MGLPSALNSEAVPSPVPPPGNGETCREQERQREANIRRELDNLLSSRFLRDSDVLKRFLCYVVEHTLAGEGDQLKEYRLGVEVFDRGCSFDPKIDPVVRMAARRLRAKLQSHYQNEGRERAVWIEIPKGGYAARFVELAPTRAPAAAAQPVEFGSPEGGKSPAHWNWKLTSAAILAVAALIFTAFYYHSHHHKALTDRDTIVLADFANSTGDPVFDDTLKTAVSISLQQSPFLNVLPEDTVASSLQAMMRPANIRLTAEVAREICQRAGSKAYLAGAIGNLGSEYVLELKAVNCQSGVTLAEEQVTAASKEKVLDALGAAASKLRAELGESLATVKKFEVPLVEATTSSLEALKAFSLGQRVFREKGTESALPFDLRSIEIDPNFALGQFEVGTDYFALNQLGRAQEYLAHAFELREHVSEREKLAIAAAYYRIVTGELDRATQIHQQAIQTYPRELLAYIRLSVDFAFAGLYEKAATLTRQAQQLDPDHAVSYEDLAEYLLALQRFDEARSIVREAQSRKLDGLLLHNTLYVLDFLHADSTGMAEQQQWYSGTPQETYGLSLASDTEAYAGHLKKARELTKRASDSAQRFDSKEASAVWQENRALREAAYGYVVESRQTAAAGIKLVPSSQGVEVEAALAFAMMGDTARAESMAQKLNDQYPLDTQIQSLWLPAIRAQVALERNNPGLALTALQESSAIEFGLIPFLNNLSCLYPVYLRGQAYLAAGQGSAAAGEFQKVLDHSGIVWNCWTGALAHLGVARANALQAKTSQGVDADAARVRALAAYKDFLTLWKDADPDIPIYKQARAEYAKMQ